jgi:hypothetical protein
MPAASPTRSQDVSLTDQVAGFILETKTSDIPEDVAYLGKRSVIDGIGLALAGAASETGAIARRYLEALRFESEGDSTVIGSRMRIPARFAGVRERHRDPRGRLRRHAARGGEGSRLRAPDPPDRALRCLRRSRSPSATNAAART